MSLPPLVVGLDLDVGRFFAKVNDAKRAIVDMGQAFLSSSGNVGKLENAAKNVGHSFKDTVMMVGALRFALMDLDNIFLAFPKSVAAASGELDRMRMLMEGLSKASTDAQRKLDAVRDTNLAIGTAKSAPFDMKAISDLLVKFRTANIDPLQGGFRSLIDTVSRFGGTSEQLKRAGVAIQQMSGKGVVSLEELRQQLAEAAPNAIESMSRGMGMSMAKMVGLISKGVVESKSALAKMFIQMEIESKGAAEKMMSTLPGALERLKTEYTLFQKQVGDQGFNTVLTRAANELTKFFESADGKNIATNLGGWLASATEGLVQLGRAAASNVEHIKAIAVALVSLYGGSKISKFLAEPMTAASKAADDLRKKAVDAATAELNARRGSAAESLRLAEDAARKRELAFESEKQTRLDALRKMRDAESAAAKAAMEELRRVQEIQKNVANMQPTFSPLQQRNKAAAPVALNPITSAMGDVSASSAQALVTANQRITSAMNDRVQAMDRAVVAAGRLDASSNKSVQTMRATADAARANVTELDRQIAALSKGVGPAQRFRDAIGAAGVAIGGFMKSLALTSVYAAAFYIASQAIVSIWDRITKAARTAEAAQRAAMDIKEGRASQSSLESLQEREKLLTEQIAEKERQAQIAEQARALRAAGIGGDDPVARRIAVTHGDPVALRAAVAQMRTELAGITRDIAENRKVLANQSEEAQATKLMGDAQKRIDDELKDFVKQQRAIEDQIAAASTQAQKDKLQEKFKDLTHDYAVAVAKGWEKIRDEVKSGKSTATGAVGEKYAELIDRQLSASRESAKLTKDNTLVAGKDKDKPGPANMLKDYLLQQQEVTIRNHEIALAIEDGVITVAEIQRRAQREVEELAKSGKLQSVSNGKQVAPSADQISQATAARAAALSAENERKAQDMVRRAKATIGQITSEMKEMMQDDGTLDKGGEKMSWAKKKIAELELYADSLKAAGFNFDQFKNGLLTGAAAIDAANVMSDLNAKIKAQSLDLLTDDRAKERERTRLTIEEVRKRVEARIKEIQSAGAVTAASTAQIAQLRAALAAFESNEMSGLVTKMRTASQAMAEEWRKGTRAMEQATASWGSNLVDQLATGEFHFGKFVQSVLQDIAKIAIKQNLADSMGVLGDYATKGLSSMLKLGNGTAQQAAAQPIIDPSAMQAAATAAGTEMSTAITTAGTTISTDWGTLLASTGMTMSTDWATVLGSSGLTLSTTFETSLTTGGLTIATAMESAGASVAAMIASAMQSGAAVSAAGSAAAAAFADGGIMTGFGPVALRKYAAGGIANSPQLALYGEGSTPEAFVPLPDGRRIPVNLQGAGQGGMPTVTVNVINQSGTQMEAKNGGTRFDGKQMILDVVMQGMSTPGGFRDSMKSQMGPKR